MGLAAKLSPDHAGDLDRKVWQARDAAERFAREPISRKLGWLYQIRERVARTAPRWAEASCQHMRVSMDSPPAGEAWSLGPFSVLRLLRLLSISLADIERHGAPKLYDKPRRLETGELAVSVFPGHVYDRGIMPGVRAEVRLQPRAGGVTRASFYAQSRPEGRVAVVLGAGNLSSIPALDALHKLFIEGQVVLLKMNPVNEYVGPLLEDVMKPLVDQGYFTVVYGGADVGSRLCHHQGVDEIHITGSDRTHDIIVWGADEGERQRRRELGQPLLEKRITSELGNITPVVVVPGLYTERELSAMADSIAGMVTTNASFNCITARMLVLPRGWPGGPQLCAALARVFASIPTRYAFYPGAEDRYRTLTQGMSDVQTFGTARDGHLPWTLIRGLDANETSSLHFRMEPFCPILSVVELDATDPAAFLARATSFCNDTLWGTLNASLFVPTSSISDPAFAAEIEKAVQSLRYGVIGINYWSGVAYPLGSPPWGAHPSSTLKDIQSGQGWVHNSLMIENIEKCVLWGPLEPPIKIPWSPLHRTWHLVAQKLCAFEAEPSLWRLSQAGFHALRA
jgi:acyl-CoA reductase-like NAD-dependent aldehyde dehydrogenase